MWAKNWRGQNVTPESLLDRYNMRIERKPGKLHVVGLAETSGRAQLRNVIAGERPTPLLWTWKQRVANGEDPLRVMSKMEWHDVLLTHENQANLVVNAASYYWPENGSDGEHIVSPAEGGDTVYGWGMAQNLPDQPTSDNRYQTLIVYWAEDSTPDPIPDPDPQPDPDPNPDPQPTPSVPQPTGRLYGVHAPKDGISDDDFAKWKRMQPGCITLTPPSMNSETVLRLRRDIPGVFILGRFFGSPEINAWKPPYWDGAAMRRYGAYCATEAARIGLDAVQFANEPGIDDPVEDGGRGAWWWTRAGYETLAHGCEAWLMGYRTVRTNALAGTVPLSPGHHEDDDPDNEGWKGADILGPVYRKFDLFIDHTYYNRTAGDETVWYHGGRLIRKLQAYAWPASKPVITAEWNRDEPKDAPFGDAEKEQDVGQSERFLQQYRNVPRYYGAARFIWRSDSFPRLSWHDNERQIALAERINTQGGSMPNPVNVESQLTVPEAGVAVPDKAFRFVVAAVRKDTMQPVPKGSLITVLVNWTRKLVDGVDTAPIPPTIKVLPADAAGKVVADIHVPAGVIPSAQATEGAYAELYVLGLADLLPEVPGTDTQFTGAARFDFNVLAKTPVDPEPGPNPDQPGPTPVPTGTSLWGYLVLIHNTAGDVDNLIAKGELDQARALNVTQQITVKSIKEMLGFP